MRTMDPIPTLDDSKALGRRIGYGIAVGINLVMVWVVYNVLEWGWPPFITEDWTRVRGVVAMSMIVAIIVNAAFILFDPRWFRGIGEAISGFASLIASLRVFSVYPFDFSPYAGPWDFLAKFILVVAIVGTVIGIVTNLGKAIRAL